MSIFVARIDDEDTVYEGRRLLKSGKSNYVHFWTHLQM